MPHGKGERPTLGRTSAAGVCPWAEPEPCGDCRSAGPPPPDIGAFCEGRSGSGNGAGSPKNRRLTRPGRTELTHPPQSPGQTQNSTNNVWAFLRRLCRRCAKSSEAWDTRAGCRQRTTSRQGGCLRLRQILGHIDAHGECVGRGPQLQWRTYRNRA